MFGEFLRCPEPIHGWRGPAEIHGVRAASRPARWRSAACDSGARLRFTARA